VENISPALLDWFYKNRRSLPFREDPTPYHVWLSEVMLQQTRVSAVLPYYYRFLEELPDIPALAACEEEKLHKLWEGLGYYSRVRNLQKAAKLVCAQYGGQLPADYAALRALPGIGESLARRIIAYREANGPLGSIEEIMEVSGIGEAKFAELEDRVTVDNGKGEVTNEDSGG